MADRRLADAYRSPARVVSRSSKRFLRGVISSDFSSRHNPLRVQQTRSRTWTSWSLTPQRKPPGVADCYGMRKAARPSLRSAGMNRCRRPASISGGQSWPPPAGTRPLPDSQQHSLTSVPSRTRPVSRLWYIRLHRSRRRLLESTSESISAAAPS